ncbi:glycosyltransferase family 9 protein [Sphingobacterium sp. UT-1RO-CII-1]|uniref:glycosyltransferase family 9 protein n=1 Tax=Sphingobacterium sp. UT-1RO-CII-1 TaxID=2995225 RepID=UPI00227CA12C|nr:glycosyltransferase family 9 protein [Sphingobacterium sp. UT-1RO-CII-1]MCY4779943.1 glycosyltransferase family 9 protein [Sphingobacterium sp. UT-1RO-CII-1]
MERVRILVIRFSAMGDVAMVASVLQEFQQQNPRCEILVLTKSQFHSFFDKIPNVHFFSISPQKKHRGLIGLWRLFRELKKLNITYVADLHNNIRSLILGFFFKITGHQVKTIDKGRKEKRQLVKYKVLTPLKHTVERYADVFRNLNFNLHLTHTLKKSQNQLPQSIPSILNEKKIKIGIAPFAQHQYKVWCLKNWEFIFKEPSFNNYQFIIFGGGEKEKKIADLWVDNHNNVYNSIGEFNLQEELDLISHLNLMISMDSSGMHMASLVGTRCFSIWGTTHPSAGFLGYGQSIDDCIQVEHPQRPNSIYGNKPCDCDGTEAINLVPPTTVIDRIKAM